MRFTPPLHRRDGYRDALHAAGHRARPRRSSSSVTSPSRAAARPPAQLLALPDRPTAIFAESDEMAYGALRELRRRRAAGARRRRGDRFRRPAAIAELMDLSTVRQPVAEQALDVTTRLLAAIAERRRVAPRPAVVLPTELIVRGIARDRPDAARSASLTLMLVDAAEPVLPGLLRAPGLDHGAGRAARERGCAAFSTCRPR